MLGYMTAKQAKAYGFTNHGSYYGIPIWVGPEEEAGLGVGDSLMVAAKWAPLALAMSFFHTLEVIGHRLRGTEPTFHFLVGDEI